MAGKTPGMPFVGSQQGKRKGGSGCQDNKRRQGNKNKMGKKIRPWGAPMRRVSQAGSDSYMTRGNIKDKPWGMDEEM